MSQDSSVPEPAEESGRSLSGSMLASLRGGFAAARRFVSALADSRTRREMFATVVQWIREAATAPPEEPASTAFMSTEPLVRQSFVIVVVFLGGLFIWAALAPLASALIAPGVLIVETHRKVIQHLEGGIVREILVSEGQKVRAGQLLVTLEDTAPRAGLNLDQASVDALAAQQARLRAELQGADQITFPPDLLMRKADPRVADAIHGETDTFIKRRDALTKAEAIYTQRNSENERIIAGLQNERTAVERQIVLNDQETESVNDLFQKGLSTQQRLLDLQRQGAELKGQLGQIVEKIAQVRLDSGENDLQSANLRNQMLSDAAKELRDAQTNRFDALDRLSAAKDVLTRTRITAPVAGEVIALAVHTRGEVIRPGDTIMEIVPAKDELTVEARIPPEDADDVHIGMAADVNLSAHERRRLPMILGTVTSVSADRMVDQRTGLSYFNVEISVNRSALRDYPDVKLIPGLPVDVAIQTGERTALDYLMEPITEVFNKGMREK